MTRASVRKSGAAWLRVCVYVIMKNAVAAMESRRQATQARPEVHWVVARMIQAEPNGLVRR